MTGDVGAPHLATDTEQFLQILARHRIAVGDSYKTLCARTGIPHSSLFDALNGRRRRPRTEVVERLIHVYARDDAEAKEWCSTWTGLLLAERDPEEADISEIANSFTPDPGPDPVDRSIPAGGFRAGVRARVHRVTRVRWSSSRLAAHAGLVVLLVAVLAGGVVRFIADRQADSETTTRPTATAQTTGIIMLTVYNVESSCQPLRTLECALALSRSPWTPSGPDNVAGRVWQGDQLGTDCVVSDGRLITDEVGMSSRRWYHVTEPGTRIVGWLPGFRTRNTRDVPACPAVDHAPVSGLPSSSVSPTG